jgi:hypothetical protein
MGPGVIVSRHSDYSASQVVLENTLMATKLSGMPVSSASGLV